MYHLCIVKLYFFFFIFNSLILLYAGFDRHNLINPTTRGHKYLEVLGMELIPQLNAKACLLKSNRPYRHFQGNLYIPDQKRMSKYKSEVYGDVILKNRLSKRPLELNTLQDIFL